MCYVLGCTQPNAVGAIHRSFGRVTSCLGHNPANVGYALPLSRPQPAPPVQVAPVPPSVKGGGQRVKVTRGPKSRPPAGAVAHPF